MKKNNIKVLYLFSGIRTDIYKGKINEDYPDTPFYGMNHLKKFGIDAEYKDIRDILKSNRVIKRLPFVWKHILLTKFIRDYDIVVGSSLLYNIVFKKIFRLKTKFVLLNISLNNTLYRNKKNIFKYKFIKYLIKQLNTIICLSHFQMDDLINNHHIPKNKLYFIPLGVDNKFWSRVDFLENKYILSVGRDNGRDYKTLFEAAKKLPHEEFRVVCAERNIKNLRIPDNVKVLLNLKIKSLKKIYESAKILLIITHSDKYSGGSDCSGQTVLLDAMSSRLPVIVSDKKYLDDYAKNGQEVLKVNFYDAADLVDKIEFLLNNRDKRLFLANNAREKVERCFTTEVMARNLARIFKSI